MKRVDDLLIWFATALTAGGWLWSQLVGSLTVHFFLLPLALLCGGVFFSRNERSQWRTRHHTRMLELEQAMEEYQRLSDAVMRDAESQFSVLEKDMEDARQIIRDSVSRLYGSLTGLESQSTDQRQVLKSLIDEMLLMTGSGTTRPSEQAGLQKFFDETNALIAEFVRKMAELREASAGIGASFDQMAGQVARITASLDDVADITKHTDMLALNAAIEAARAGDEVRKLAARTGGFNNEIRNALNDILRSLQDVGVRVESATHTDLSIAENSQENLANLGNELLELTTKAREHSRHITDVTEQIHRLTQEGVQAMQFEDIVSQMMGRITQRTLDVGSYLHRFMRLHQDRDEADGLQRFRTRIEQLRSMQADAQAKRAAPASAVGRENTSIELF